MTQIIDLSSDHRIGHQISHQTQFCELLENRPDGNHLYLNRLKIRALNNLFVHTILDQGLKKNPGIK